MVNEFKVGESGVFIKTITMKSRYDIEGEEFDKNNEEMKKNKGKTKSTPNKQKKTCPYCGASNETTDKCSNCGGELN